MNSILPKSPYIDLCQMPIVLPSVPTEIEKTAARELSEYIIKISGKTPPALQEGQEIIGSIYIGKTRFATENGCSYTDNAFGEGWAIQAINGNLVLVGGTVRGVLYAVYHLLEDVAGVRWWNLWEEYVPSRSEVHVPADYVSSGVPAMESRDEFMFMVKTDSLFCVRNRLNSFAVVNAPANYGGKEDFGLPAHVHTLYRYFPAYYADGVFSEPACPYDVDPAWRDMNNPDKENYLETHPEWFALTNRNKRVPNRFCLSNKGFRQAFREKLLNSIRYCYEKADTEGTARPRYFDISLSDTAGECQCDACKASIATRGLSGHLLHFVNEMAQIVEPLYPEIRIETISYSNYLEPPLDDTRPADNVVLIYANCDMDILHDLKHRNNKEVMQRLLAWKALCKEGNFYFWDYGVVYSQNGIFPNMYRYAENFPLLQKLGVNGYSLEIEHCINTDFWDMKVWLAAKLAENPDSDFNALLDNFIIGYYGCHAGPHIRRYLDYMHEKAEACTDGYRYTSSISRGEWLSVEDILLGCKIFDEAFRAAEGDGTVLRRLRAARSGIDRVIADNYDTWALQAASKNIPFTIDKTTVIKRLIQTFAEQTNLRGEWDYLGETLFNHYQELLTGASVNTTQEESQKLLVARANGYTPSTVGAVPVIVSEDELQGKNKCYIFTAKCDFSTIGNPILEDPQSKMGKAAVYDMKAAMDAGIRSYDAIKQKWAVTDGDDCKTIPIGVYLGIKDADGMVLSTQFGVLRASDIRADGEYHLYKFGDIVPIERTDAITFHIFRTWEFQIYTLPFELRELKGRKMDFYLSMKVSGDVSCDDLNNLPSYSIDRIIFTEQ